LPIESVSYTQINFTTLCHSLEISPLQSPETCLLNISLALAESQIC